LPRKWRAGSNPARGTSANASAAIMHAAMTIDTATLATGAPLTSLSEEESMFQQSVRDFAV
jgi:hypothetical protein